MIKDIFDSDSIEDENHYKKIKNIRLEMVHGISTLSPYETTKYENQIFDKIYDTLMDNDYCEFEIESDSSNSDDDFGADE